MAGGDVQEFLGSSRALVSQLMNQRLTGSPGQEASYNVGVGDVRELIALSGEAPDVPAEGLTGLLTTVLEIPWVPRELVCALEVSHKDLLQICPTLDCVGWPVFQPARAELAKNSGRLRIMKLSLSTPPAW